MGYQVFVGTVVLLRLIKDSVASSSNSHDTETVYLHPRTHGYTITLDLSDDLHLDLSQMFDLPANSTSSNLELKIYHQSSDLGSTLTIRLEDLLQYHEDDVGTTSVKHPVVASLSGFDHIYNTNKANFQEYCLLAYFKTSRTVPVPSEANCQLIQLRVVNNSLDFTDLAQFAYGKNMSLIAAPSFHGISFSSISRGLLPTYLKYDLHCTSSSINSPEKPPKPPESVFKSSAISSREIDDPLFEPFSGTQQVYLDGYIIDYDLEEGYFGLMQSSVGSYQFVSGVFLPSKCQSVSFHSFQGLTKHYIYVLCVGADRLHITQFTVVETMVKHLKLKTSVFVPTSTHNTLLIPGRYIGCNWVDVEDIIACKTVNKSLSLIQISREPLKLQSQQVIEKSVFEAHYSESFDVPREGFYFDLILTTSFDRLLFRMKNTVSNVTKLVWFENLDLRLMIQDTDPTEQTIFQAEDGGLDFSNKTSTCITKEGIYYYDKTQRCFYFVPQLVGGKMLLKNVSKVEGELHNSVCYSEHGFWLVNLLARKPLSEKIVVRTILLDGQAGNGQFDATSRVRADLEYYFPYETKVINEEPFSKPMWIAYYDAQNNSLVWHGSNNPDAYSVSQTLRGKRYQLDLDEESISVSTFDPGMFTCRLVGTQIIDINATSFKLDLDIKVLEFPSVKVVQTQQIAPISVNTTDSSLLTADWNIEDYYSVVGPFRALHTSFHLNKSELGDDFGSMSLKPRLTHKYTVDVGDPTAGYNLILPVSADLLIGVKDSQVDALTRKEGSAYFDGKHEIPYYQAVDFFTNYNFDKQRYFNRLESVKVFPHKLNNTELLLIVGFSEVIVKKDFKPETVSYVLAYRKMCFILVELSKFQLFTKPICPTIAMEVNTSVEQNWKIFKDKHTDLGEEQYSVSLLPGSFGVKANCFHAIKSFVLTQNVTRFYEGGGLVESTENCKLASMDTYWNEDDQTYHFVSFLFLNGDIHLQEYSLGVRGWRLLSSKRLFLDSLPGRLSQISCSIAKSKCLFVLSTNLLGEAEYRYHSARKVFQFSLPANSQDSLHQVNTVTKISKVVMGLQYFFLQEEDSHSGFQIYSYGGLASVHTTIPPQYGTQMGLTFAPGCSLKHVLEGSCRAELVLHTTGRSTAQMYGLGPFKIGFVKVPYHYLKKPLRVTIELHSEPEMTEMLSQVSKNHLKPLTEKMDFTLEFKKLSRFDSHLVTPENFWMIFFLCLLVVLILVLFLNHVGYKLAERDSVYLQEDTEDIGFGSILST